jgi:hypothetical protein
MSLILGLAYIAAVVFAAVAAIYVGFVLFLIVRAYVLTFVDLCGRIVALFRRGRRSGSAIIR